MYIYQYLPIIIYISINIYLYLLYIFYILKKKKEIFRKQLKKLKLRNYLINLYHLKTFQNCNYFYFYIYIYYCFYNIILKR